MSYNNPRNNKYNTRHSGRFNRSGSFVPATSTNHQTFEVPAPAAPAPVPAAPAPVPAPTPVPAPQLPPLPPTPVAAADIPTPLKNEDQEMLVAGCENQSSTSGSTQRMPFFKTKLGGVKKITNKERRRRQNALLRRLTTPKNALMCINEMLPHEQIANQFKVESAPADGTYYNSGVQNFCAELTVDGQTYKGFGENKMTARNAAAEQAIRDIVLKKMERYSETVAANAAAIAANALAGAAGANAIAGAAGANADADADAAANANDGAGGEGDAETEALPMIQILSFALHKLFAEWEGAGHHVPQLRPNKGDRWQSTIEEESLPLESPPKEPKMLPENASSMHPGMLLAMMRPTAAYRELGTEGDKPHNMLFTICVEVDEKIYIGKAPSKKEARKNAARVACKTLWGITFDDQKFNVTSQ